MLPGALRDAAGLLRANRLYRRYFLARFTSVTGSTVATLAEAFAVLHIGGGATALGLVLVTGPVIYVVLSPVGGVLADRLSRNAIVTTCQSVNAITQGTAAVLVLTGYAKVWHLAVLAMVAGATVAFFHPAVQGLVPKIVTREQLREANAVKQLAMNAVAIAGPAPAGLLIAAAGPGWVLLWDCFTFVVSAVLFSTLRQPRLKGRANTQFAADLRQGWSAFATRRWLWVLTLQSMVTSGCWAAGFSVLGPIYARDRLGGAAGWGLIGSSLGLGRV